MQNVLLDHHDVQAIHVHINRGMINTCKKAVDIAMVVFVVVVAGGVVLAVVAIVVTAVAVAVVIELTARSVIGAVVTAAAVIFKAIIVHAESVVDTSILFSHT
jgi:hypothetical protein